MTMSSHKEPELNAEQKRRLKDLLEQSGGDERPSDQSGDEVGKTPFDEEPTLDHPSDMATEPPPPGGKDLRNWNSAQAMRDEAPPRETIGPYRINRLIGGGGMGQVYEATQDHPRRKVALKVMRGSIDSDAARKRFDFEVQILARLHHPNIAQIFDAGIAESEDRQIPYFVMEYVPGKTIDRYATERSLSTEQRLKLFVQICEAVSHGHERGIIHRDLKPGNILVDGDGNVKVIDFGVARATDSDMQATKAQTNVGQIVGTLQYMSPEQCAADPNDIDIRSDVYALGIMLFELISGKLPYDLGNTAIHEAVRIVQEVEPESITSIDRTISRDIDTIITKAMEKERQRRYRSAGELGDDIRRYLNDEAIVARPPSITEHLSRFARKHRATSTAMVAVALAIVVAIVLIIFFGLEADAQRRIAFEERNKAIYQKSIADEATAVASMALASEKEARAEAEERGRVISNAALELFGPIASQIKNLPLAMKTRERLIVSGMNIIQALEALEGSDADAGLMGRIALGHEALGDLVGGGSTADLGRPEEALQHYEHAMAIWNELRKNTDSIEPDVNYARMLERQVELIYQSDPKRARELLTESRRINLDLLNRFPDRDEQIRNYYAMLGRLADTMLQTDQMNEALIYSIEFRDMASMLQSKDPDQPNYNRDLALALRRTGYIRMELKQFNESQSDLTLSLELMERSRELDPSSIRRTADIGWSCWHLGEFHFFHGDQEKGVEFLSRSTREVVLTCSQAPRVEDYRRFVTQLVPAVHQILRDARRSAEAESVRRGALLGLQVTVESDPNNIALSEVWTTLQGLPSENSEFELNPE